jgi:hypothetical protein
LLRRAPSSKLDDGIDAEAFSFGIFPDSRLLGVDHPVERRQSEVWASAFTLMLLALTKGA